MFDQLKEKIKQHLAYNAALKEAEHKEKLKSIPLEAKIRNDLRLKALKNNVTAASKVNKAFKPKMSSTNKATGFDIMNGEF